MARSTVCVLVAVALSLLVQRLAFAWGAKGHEIIAYIAEAHLSESARNKIKEILPKNDSLVQASLWADREGRKIRLFTPFHYVDVPRGGKFLRPPERLPQR